MSLKIKNSKGEWVVDQKAIQTSIIDLEGNFESKNVEGALRELASKKSRSTDELEGKVELNRVGIEALNTRVSKNEEDVLSEKGFTKTSLGESVLRTETVPLMIASILKYLRDSD
jgi:hypothetical protein